jgi:hypothetical protein
MIKTTIKIEGIEKLGSELEKEIKTKIAKQHKTEIEESEIGKPDPDTDIIRSSVSRRKKK